MLLMGKVEGVEIGLTLGLGIQDGTLKLTLKDCGCYVKEIFIKLDGGASWFYQGYAIFLIGCGELCTLVLIVVLLLSLHQLTCNLLGLAGHLFIYHFPVLMSINFLNSRFAILMIRPACLLIFLYHDSTSFLFIISVIDHRFT